MTEELPVEDNKSYEAFRKTQAKIMGEAKEPVNKEPVNKEKFPPNHPLNQVYGCILTFLCIVACPITCPVIWYILEFHSD